MEDKPACKAVAVSTTGLPVGIYQKMPAGLIAFGGRMSDIWFAAADDDPYADQYLLKVEDKLAVCHQQLVETYQCYRLALDEINHANHLKVLPMRSIQPFITKLEFRIPHAYHKFIHKYLEKFPMR